MKRFTVIVNVNLEYEFETDTAQQAYIESQHVELPSNYVEGSRDTVKILDDNGEEYEFDPQENGD